MVWYGSMYKQFKHILSSHWSSVNVDLFSGFGTLYQWAVFPIFQRNVTSLSSKLTLEMEHWFPPTLCQHSPLSHDETLQNRININSITFSNNSESKSKPIIFIKVCWDFVTYWLMDNTCPLWDDFMHMKKYHKMAKNYLLSGSWHRTSTAFLVLYYSGQNGTSVNSNKFCLPVLHQYKAAVIKLNWH